MLGIILTYYNCEEFFPYQLKNFKKFIKCPYQVFVVDDSPMGLDSIWKICSENGIVCLKSSTLGSASNPSTRHQNAVNQAFNVAQYACDSFLIFDNDMIFLTDFHLPTKPCWHAMQSPKFRLGHSKIDRFFAWLNIMFLTEYHYFEYFEDSDSGGSIIPYLETHDTDKITIVEKIDHPVNEYITKYEELSKEYNITPFQEILNINGCFVYHFRAMSNYPLLDKEFMTKKKELVMSFLERWI